MVILPLHAVSTASDFCTSFISSSDVLRLMKAHEDGSGPCSAHTGSSRPQTHQQRLRARVNEPVGPGAPSISLQRRSREMHDEIPPHELLIRADERPLIKTVITTGFCSSAHSRGLVHRYQCKILTIMCITWHKAEIQPHKY